MALPARNLMATVEPRENMAHPCYTTEQEFKPSPNGSKMHHTVGAADEKFELGSTVRVLCALTSNLGEEANKKSACLILSWI